MFNTIIVLVLHHISTSIALSLAPLNPRWPWRSAFPSFRHSLLPLNETRLLLLFQNHLFCFDYSPSNGQMDWRIISIDTSEPYKLGFICQSQSWFNWHLGFNRFTPEICIWLLDDQDSSVPICNKLFLILAISCTSPRSCCNCIHGSTRSVHEQKKQLILC